jgi:hypothetical protein
MSNSSEVSNDGTRNYASGKRPSGVYLSIAELVKELPLIPVLPPHHRRLSCRRLSRNHCSLSFSTPFRQHRPISEMAASLVEVGLLRHSGLDALTLSSSHFDPQPTWVAPNG